LSVGFLVPGHSFQSESFVEFGLRFSAQDSTAPVLSDFVGSFVVVGLYGFDEFGEFLFVLVFDFGESDTGALFSSDELSESGFAFDDTVRNVHLSAESWKVDDDFNWVDIVGDNDKLGLFSLDEVNDLVDTAGQSSWSLAWGIWLSVSSCFSSGDESLFFLGLVFWGVLLSQLKQLSSGLLVQSLSELVDGRRNLQSLLEDGSLSLEFDVFWPSDESGQVSFWLDILADSEVLSSFLEQRVGGRLLFASEFFDWRGSHSFTFSYHFFVGKVGPSFGFL
jgi:hypothetical protein